MKQTESQKTLRKKQRFLSYLKNNGYTSIVDFFTDPKIAFLTKKNLAQTTGFSYECITMHYRKFRQQILEEQERLTKKRHEKE